MEVVARQRASEVLEIVLVLPSLLLLLRLLPATTGNDQLVYLQSWTLVRTSTKCTLPVDQSSTKTSTRSHTMSDIDDELLDLAGEGTDTGRKRKTSGNGSKKYKSE